VSNPSTAAPDMCFFGFCFCVHYISALYLPLAAHVPLAQSLASAPRISLILDSFYCACPHSTLRMLCRSLSIVYMPQFFYIASSSPVHCRNTTKIIASRLLNRIIQQGAEENKPTPPRHASFEHSVRAAHAHLQHAFWDCTHAQSACVRVGCNGQFEMFVSGGIWQRAQWRCPF